MEDAGTSGESAASKLKHTRLTGTEFTAAEESSVSDEDVRGRVVEE